MPEELIDQSLLEQTKTQIKKLVADADVELNLEPGDTPDVMTVWRKGSSSVHIEVKGRAAHAGIAPQEGRNAATELIQRIDDWIAKSMTPRIISPLSSSAYASLMSSSR